ncbi:MAG: glycosyltransferase [Chloroflexi bacterium]|nr:glycosyltransferase [Chloroflexota bacterium]
MTLLLLFVGSALVVIALIAVLNTFTFHRLGRAADAANAALPRVSVLIPARNEAAVIVDTVRALLAQGDVVTEILVLDDHSSDGTGDLLRALNDARVRVLQGQALPSGWGGKNWACWQLAQQARAEILLFTDADVRWNAGAVRAVVRQMQRSRADLLTVWPTQITLTWGERLVVPLMALVILGYLPAPGVYCLPFASLAAANGQCLAFRRAAYDAIDGHQAAKGSIIEDITLARRIKRKGLRLDMADGASFIACRMYRSWRDVRDGYAKNILAGYGNSLFFLALASLFHWLLFLLPPLWLALGWLSPTADYPLAPLLLTTIGVLIRALTAASTCQRIADALLLPLSVLLMTRIAAQAVYWRLRYGGPQWKGRTFAATSQQ